MRKKIKMRLTAFVAIWRCNKLTGFFIYFVLFVYCSLFREGCAGCNLKLSCHISRSSITSIISLNDVPSNSIQDPQCTVFGPSTEVLGRPTDLFPFSLASEACWGVFPEAFSLHGQTIEAEIFQF